MIDPVVTQFVDATLARLRDWDMMNHLAIVIPDAMLADNFDRKAEWSHWKPIPSTVTDEQLDSLEQEIGLTYPPLYRDFLRYVHFIELSLTDVAFERHSSTAWMESLRILYRGYLPERIVGVGLIPFGSFSDFGLVCFDTRSSQSDDDCPIVYWDHDWVETEQEVNPLFSSSAKMFECLTFVAKHDTPFFYHDEARDDPSELALKADLLRQFFAIDTDGAGGPARRGWSRLGIDLEK